MFRNWVFQNFPFLEDDFDALTDYELFCKMVEYAKSLAISNDKFVSELESNLERMYNEGKFDSFIEEIINLQTTFTFDSVADMKSATNLIDGSYAKTLGFYEKNDNGASYYYIRSVTDSDTIDEKTIISINENLVAVLLKEKTMNPTQFGAYGDGTHDDTNSINTCINYTNNILFTKGTYLINPLYNDSMSDNTCINIKSNRIIDFNNSTITISNTDEMLGYIIRCYGENNVTIKNGFIVGYDLTEQIGIDCQQMGIAIMDSSNIVIENMNIKNCRGDGIYIREDHEYARFENFYINNCNFNGQPKSAINISPVDTTIPCYGIVENCNILNCAHAILGTRGGRNQDSVYIKNINITGCVLPPISMTRGSNNMNITFENITVNSFNYTGSEDLNYMFYLPGRESEGVSNVSIINPVCKANCPLVFMNNGINNVSIINPIYENGNTNNSWGVLGGRTASSKLILKDDYNQIRMTIDDDYEPSNISVPSNIIIDNQSEIIDVTIINNLLCEGNEITIFNKGIYKVNINLQGNRTITIPEYQGYVRVIKMMGELMFYGNLTKWENLPQT